MHKSVQPKYGIDYKYNFSPMQSADTGNSSNLVPQPDNGSLRSRHGNFRKVEALDPETDLKLFRRFRSDELGLGVYLHGGLLSTTLSCVAAIRAEKLVPDPNLNASRMSARGYAIEFGTVRCEARATMELNRRQASSFQVFHNA
jgi:hypothetical protein